MERDVSARYDASVATGFRLATDESGHEFGEVVFGNDIYPGTGVVDPNSALSLDAAVAHELSHFHRWKNKTELPAGELAELDEALTSLEAALRYEKKLSENDIRQLVRDSLQRLQLYRSGLRS